MPAEGAAARALVHAAAVTAVKLITEDLGGRAQRLAPVEEGTLRGSMETDVKVTPTTITGEVSFNTVYAARQHEETDWRHPLGGQAKYLEQPLRETAGRYRAILQAAVNRALS